MKVGSVFSGIEGLGLGFHLAGGKIAWQCEIDPDARAVLEEHFPNTPRFSDVREIHGRSACPDHIRLAGVSSERHFVEGQSPVVDSPQTEPCGNPAREQNLGAVLAASGGTTGSGDGGTCERCVPDVDVLVGGFPCQDISVAGRRAGLAGNRSGLFHEFMRLVGELAPRWVLIENVPGLLSSGHRPDCTGWDLPDNPETTEDTRRCGSCDPGADMATVLGTLADLGYGWAYRVLDAQLHNTESNQAGKFYEEYTPSLQADSPPPAVAYRKAQKAHDPDDCERWEEAEVVDTVSAHSTTSGSAVVEARSIAVRGRDDGQEWELGEAEIGNTLRAGDGGSSRGNWALTPTMAVRRLTALECERLQGFPDFWTASRSDSARYRLLGNAVCVPVAAWIASRLVGLAETEGRGDGNRES